MVPLYLVVLLVEWVLLGRGELVEDRGILRATYRVTGLLWFLGVLLASLLHLPINVFTSLLLVVLPLSHIQRLQLVHLSFTPYFFCVALVSLPFTILMFLTTPLHTYFWEPLFFIIVPRCYSQWNASVYIPLEDQRKQVRVIVLEPGHGNAPIHCTLNQQPLDGVSFEALSYTWGGHRALRSQIYIDGRTFLVTRNVLHALQTLRHPEENRRLWIDQICINQADLVERSAQVQYCMSDVYRRASRVIVWLGASPNGLHAEFDSILQATTYVETSSIQPLLMETKPLQKVRSILKRRWWDRMWVVQEVALAQTLILRCGEEEIDWDLFCEFVLRHQDMYQLKSGTKQLLALRTRRENLLKQTLLELVLRFHGRGVSDYRDSIFGLYSLAIEEQFKIDVDYRRDYQDIYADFCVRTMKETGSLEILALADGHVSWSRYILKECSWLAYIDRRKPPKYAQAFWGPDSETFSTLKFPAFNASGSSRANVNQHDGNGRWLCVQGHKASRIKTIGQSSLLMSRCFWNVVNAWSEVAGIKEEGDPRVAAFWQTLMTGANGADESIMPEEGDLSPADVAKLTCPLRRFFVTEDGSYGLGPGSIRVGDGIYILPGAAVPLILRRKDHKSLPEFLYPTQIENIPPEFYVLIGACYVHGRMDNPDFPDKVASGEIVLEDLWLT